MSSITTQIHSLAAEVKDRFRQMMDKIHEEAGTSSTGRVRLKTQLDKEEKDRQALERQVRSLRKETKTQLSKAAEERRRLRMQIEKVEDERAKLGEQVASLEIRVKDYNIHGHACCALAVVKVGQAVQESRREGQILEKN